MALTVPNTFVAGTTAVASEVNDNFVAVKVFVDGLETDVAALEIKSPVITLAGDLTGSATLTNLGNATLTATIAANSVALGTDTTGNYVSNVTAGTGVTVTHTPGEGSSAAVAIDGTVVTLSGTQTLTNKTLTSPTITGVSPVVTLSGDVTGSATLTNLGSATITTTIAANSVALGADTTGNYVSTITAGTGITGSASSESATPTIAIDAAVVPQLGVANTFTTNQVIAASSTSDLLRITQTGTGNALVVEDSANPDSTPFVVSATGVVGIGVPIPLSNLHILAGTATGVSPGAGGRLFIDGANANQWIDIAGATTSEVGLRFGDSGAIQRGRIGYTNTTDSLDFFTAGSERMRIDSSGNVGVGVTPTVRLDVLGSTTVGTQVNVAAAFGAVSTGRLLVGSITGNAPFIGSESTNPLLFTTNGVERMRIDSAGRIGIGSGAGSDTGFSLTSNLTGAATVYGIRHFGTIQSDATANTHVISAQPSTAAAAFTATKVNNFSAFGGTVGATSAIGTQVGYFAAASLTVATNNYAFQGSIANGTGRWNLYMNGTAGNYLAGRLGVGAILTSGSMAQITNTTAADVALTVKGAASQTGLLLDVQNSAGTTLTAIDSAGRLIAGSGTAVDINGIPQFSVIQSVPSIAVGRFSNDSGYPRLKLSKSRSGTLGTNTVVQSGDGVGTIEFLGADGTSYVRASEITSAVDGTPGTNDMPGRLVFSTTADGSATPTERMRINSAGEVGIGGTTTTAITLRVTKNITGGTSGYGVVSQGTIQSDVTTAGYAYFSNISTQATAFTLPTLSHYIAVQGTIGVGSTVTTQSGFHVNNSLTGATNNYAFRGQIASGTNRFNLYMQGTAANYMAGRLGVGATLTSGAMAQVTNTTAADKALIVKGAASQTGDLLDIQNSAGTTQFEIDSAGQVGVGVVQAATSLNVSKSISGSVNSQAVRIASPVASGVTGEARYMTIVPSVDASVAAGNLVGIKVFGATLGAGASITTQYGFWVDSGFTTGTTNYGFRGAIASGASRWNLYMDGTAANHLAGNLCVGTTAIATSADKAIHIGDGTAPTANIASGGILYVESGALKYRGSSGTVTTLGNA